MKNESQLKFVVINPNEGEPVVMNKRESKGKKC
jgi:hypothetical protein